MTDTVSISYEVDPIFAAPNTPAMDPRQIQIDNRARQINEKVDHKILEARTHLLNKLNEIENDSEYDMETKNHKKQKANK